MDVFDLRNRLVSDYRSYTRSFIKIRDLRIKEFVDGILGAEGFWPEPLLQLNPTFRPGGTIDDLVELGILHRECSRIFRIDKSAIDHRGKQLLLHQHQREAIQPRGFNLDVERGYWSRNQADAADRDEAMTEGRVMRVVPFVKDTKNALVMRFEPPRPGPETASLQAAFKQAIQQHFQLAPRELSCEPMPSPRLREEVFFYEVSEGGAGVLRRLVDDPAVLPALARRALAICHYDPDTLEDRAAERCGKACYESLLDYANQPDHKDLDRALIRDLLADLARAECRPAGSEGSRAEPLAALRKRCDSRLEERWLDRLNEWGLRLPSDAQYRIPSYATQPDFFYRDASAAIYIDGPPHDSPHQVREDDATTETLIAMGYIVIRFHHEDDWLSIFRRHADVFGTPNE